MAGIIEDFYYGNLEPQEYCDEHQAKLKKTHTELTELEKQLSEKLISEDRDMFMKYSELYLKFLSDSNLDSFTLGFRYGARFTYDTFITR